MPISSNRIRKTLRAAILLTAHLWLWPHLSAGSELTDDLAYNHAMNALRPAAERLSALQSLANRHSFKEMENMFLELLSNPDEHVLVKKFILETAAQNAGGGSELYIPELFPNRLFDAETRRMALALLWKERLLTVKDLDMIITDASEELPIREYAVMLLRQFSDEEAKTVRALLSRLAENPTAESTLRLQALASLSLNLKDPDVSALFIRIASDPHAPLDIRRLALLNIHQDLDLAQALTVDRTILYDEKTDTEIRVLALRLIPKSALPGEAAGLRKLEAETKSLELKKEIRERLETKK